MQNDGRSIVDLRPKHRTEVLNIIRNRLPDARIWVYGSRAKGDARLYSDLDLILDDHNRPISGSIMGSLDEDFDESDLPIIVVLHDMASTDAEFLERIRRDFLLLN